MAVAPHFAARQLFLTRFDEFLTRGCARWQRGIENWRSLPELKRSEPPERLKIPTFLKMECEDAGYKFWMAVKAGAENAEEISVRTRRVFDQFLERAAASSWFKDEELHDLKTFFDKHYWPIERTWREQQQTKQQCDKLFAELGGHEAVARIPTNADAFYEWSAANITTAYNNNGYQQALILGEVSVNAACNIIEKSFAEIDVPVALCAVQEVAYPATLARLNCWSPEPGILLRRLDQVAKTRVPLSMLDGRGRNLLARFATNAVAIKNACTRFETDKPLEASLAGIYASLGAIRFHRHIRKGVSSEWSVGVDSTNITLLLSELLEMRSDWLRQFGLFRSMNEVPEFESRARDLLTAAIGETVDASLVDETISFMCEPDWIVEEEWKAFGTGEASRAGWTDVSVARLGASAMLQRDNLDPQLAYAWILRAKERLEGCGNFLAWSEFYCLCDEYMSQRGHLILCDYALNNVRKLQRAAGNQGAVHHFEETVLAVASRLKKKPPNSKPVDDASLQWFLREEPPPLNRK